MTDIIATVLPFLLPFIVGWLLKSPIGKYVPDSVVEVIKKLTPEQWSEISTAVISRKRDRELAVEFICYKGRQYGIEIDESTALAIVDYIGGRLKIKR